MSNREQRLRELFPRFLANNLSETELDEFLQILDDPSLQKQVKELMDHSWSDIYAQEHPHAHSTPVVTMRKKSRFQVFVPAAAVILLLFISGYFILRDTDPPSTGVNAAAKTIHPIVSDPAPGRNLATLTLGNGTKITLDSSRSGTLASQGNVKIIKLSPGQLSYAASGSNNGEVLYNSISTPRGGQYQIQLADGSEVWLNAASSLRFPAVFKGAQRTVELTGEAYFEVAPNKERPFVVRVNGSEVKVLGTHFNINAYSDEPLLKTTLLEGSVEVSKGANKGLLIPGQQAQLSQNGESLKIAAADTEEAVAWKNGFFQFNRSDIESVMKQISRWYDLDVRYEGEKPTGHFRGKIARTVYLSEMLKVIEASGVQFNLQGKTLIVIR